MKLLTFFTPIRFVGFVMVCLFRLSVVYAEQVGVGGSVFLDERNKGQAKPELLRRRGLCRSHGRPSLPGRHAKHRGDCRYHTHHTNIVGS